MDLWPARNGAIMMQVEVLHKAAVCGAPSVCVVTSHFYLWRNAPYADAVAREGMIRSTWGAFCLGPLNGKDPRASEVLPKNENLIYTYNAVCLSSE